VSAVPSAPAIETERLTKRYGSARGVEDIDLRVEQGEVFGFLGPNGAGKTTLIRTLLDLLRPTSGSARVLGLDSRNDSLEIRQRVAYLPGDLELYEKLTVREHLRWLGDLAGEFDPGRMATLAERFQLDLDRRVRELSKGNRQKVGLVQALMRDAEVRILDEPTSGLDPVMQHEFHRLVQEEAAGGRTVFLSSHQLDEVQVVADRVGIIREGHMVAVEEIAALRARAVRHVHATFSGAVPADELRAVPGVHDVVVDDSSVTLRIDGSFDPLVKALARHHVLDLDSEPADLDEIFLAYYAGDEPEPERRADA
jgi:ABC-2 type transport system ATP-binding protein